MKQIKVSTVKMESNVEVLFINSAIISKSLKAQMAAEHILEEMRKRDSVRELEMPEQVDENGNPKTKFVKWLWMNGYSPDELAMNHLRILVPV